MSAFNEKHLAENKAVVQTRRTDGRRHAAPAGTGNGTACKLERKNVLIDFCVQSTVRMPVRGPYSDGWPGLVVPISRLVAEAESARRLIPSNQAQKRFSLIWSLAMTGHLSKVIRLSNGVSCR